MAGVKGAGISRETATDVRNEAIRIQFSVEVARGKSPCRAVASVAYRSGLKQSQVREIVQDKLSAVRRLTNQESS